MGPLWVLIIQKTCPKVTTKWSVSIKVRACLLWCYGSSLSQHNINLKANTVRGTSHTQMHSRKQTRWVHSHSHLKSWWCGRLCKVSQSLLWFVLQYRVHAVKGNLSGCYSAVTGDWWKVEQIQLSSGTQTCCPDFAVRRRRAEAEDMNVIKAGLTRWVRACVSGSGSSKLRACI